jgi:hypothetical protein
MKDSLATSLYTSISLAEIPRAFDKWHASNIAECPRAQYFRRAGVEPIFKASAGKVLRWQAGHLMEEAIRPHIKTLYPDLQSNVRLDSDVLDLTGEYDNYSQKNQTIIEVKTVHDYAFVYKKKQDARFDLRDFQPYLNHELQNHCYVMLLREKDFPVSQIVYIYISLDGRIATYKTPVNPRLIAKVYDRLKLLNKAWELQEPPACLCVEGHELWNSTTQYCPYRDKSVCCSLNLLNGADASDWSEA